MKTSGKQIREIPSHFRIAVIMQRRPSRLGVWCDYEWKAIGITVTQNDAETTTEPRLVHEDNDTQHYLLDGFNVNLYMDECESYYYNLMSPIPRCYVVAHHEEGDESPVPFLVSFSFDEAHAYLEGDEDVYDVDIPPELYRWVETFVLANYAPEKRIKRKRKNWKNPDKPVVSF